MHGNDTTSAEALESLAPHLSHLNRTVFEAVRNSPEGLTRDEISATTGILIQSVCGRVVDLVRSGHIFETGLRRKTRSGRFALVLSARKQ